MADREKDITVEIGPGLRDLAAPFIRAMEEAQDRIGGIYQEAWRTGIVTITGGPANKTAYVTGAYYDSIALANAMREGDERVIIIESDQYQDASVAAKRYPGIGDLIEIGSDNYPGRFQAQIGIQDAEQDVLATLGQYSSLAIAMVMRA